MILAPYTPDRQDPRARDLLEQHSSGITWARIDPADRQAYGRLLADAWTEPGDLTIIEHDIGIRAGVVEELARCSQPWCGFPYPIADRLLVCLGCTRFSHHLKASLPALMAEAVTVGDAQDGGGVPAGDWARLDVRIACLLERSGHQRHYHWPPVQHFHTYPRGMT